MILNLFLQTTNKWKKTLAVVFIISTALAVLHSQENQQTTTPPTKQSLNAKSLLKKKPIDTTTIVESNRNIQETTPNTDPHIIENIRLLFGSKINSPVIQVHLLEKLMAYCKNEEINNCDVISQRILTAAFPGLADELNTRLSSLIKYHLWGREQRQVLNQLSEMERKRILWDKRRSLFGIDAELIWEADFKNEKLRVHIKKSDTNTQTSLPGKLENYHNGIKNAYGENSTTEVNNNQLNYVNQFITMSSVQKQLQLLPENEQAEVLEAVRRSMDMNNDAIERWRNLDQERNERWSNGHKYMAERGAIISTFPEQYISDKLDQLRGNYFGAMANNIKAEENSGYYRFSRPQIIGKN